MAITVVPQTMAGMATLAAIGLSAPMPANRYKYAISARPMQSPAAIAQP